MKDYLSEIDDRFPIRNSAAQKAAFRSYALSEAEAAAVPARTEENERHQNLVFSDPTAASVIFTAHYDTPRRSLLPNLMLVNNPVLSFLYHLFLVLLILLPSIGAALSASALLRLDMARLSDRLLMLAIYMAVYFLLFFLLMRGPANRRNRNDNTSGTAAVLTLLRLLREQPGIAYLLFDDEELGKKGSKAFAKAHPEIKQNALIVNLDCVGNGDCLVFCPVKGAENSPLYAALRVALEGGSLPVRFFSAGRAKLNSDHLSFDRGVGVCVCRHKPLLGYYTGRIHTSRDTAADPETVRRLAEALAAFASRQGG